MKTVALSDFMVTRGGSLNPKLFADEKFELYSIPAHDRGCPDIVLGAEIGSSKQIVQPGDVMVSKIVPHIRRARKVEAFQGRRQIASGEWIVFRGPQFEANYLRHFLISDAFHAQFMKTIAGVGGSLMRARPAQVKAIQLPLPSLPEQRRIAAILDQADAIRAKRRQLLTHLDALVQSTYFDMFERDEWPSRPLVDLALSPGEIKCGPFGTQLNVSEFRSSGVPLLGIKNVNAKFSLPPFEFLDEATAARLSPYDLRPGDLVMTRKGTIGNCAIYPSSLPAGVMHSDLLRARISPAAADVVFLEHHLQLSPRVSNQIKRMSPGAVMPGINVTKLKQLSVDAPPITLQRDFAKRVDVVGRQLAVVRRALAADDELFASLQSRAFKGEL